MKIRLKQTQDGTIFTATEKRVSKWGIETNLEYAVLCSEGPLDTYYNEAMYFMAGCK
jgi:hypothetical protein